MSYQEGFEPQRQNGKYPNISLDSTQNIWNSIEGKATQAVKLMRRINRAMLDDTQKRIYDALMKSDIAKLEAAIENNKSTHALQSSVDIDWSAKNDISVTITQTYGGQPVENGQETLKCTIDAGSFTLSMGPLFSKVQNRQYTSTAVPSAGGTTNVLGVQYGSGLRPAGTALVNFAIPPIKNVKLAGQEWGLYLSAGPTIKSSADSTSSFGWFVGPSLAINRQLYLSPGFHYGEFADFPTGYAPGSPIPEGVGMPNPVKRNTWRFAFAISFRVAGFGSKDKTPAPTTGKVPAKPQE